MNSDVRSDADIIAQALYDWENQQPYRTRKLPPFDTSKGDHDRSRWYKAADFILERLKDRPGFVSSRWWDTRRCGLGHEDPLQAGDKCWLAVAVVEPGNDHLFAEVVVKGGDDDGTRVLIRRDVLMKASLERHRSNGPTGI